MNKLLLVTTVLFTSIASAAPKIDVYPETQGTGAWVTITNQGQPVADAIVNEKYTTDQHGRVFVYNWREFSSTIKYEAVTPEGEMINTQRYVPRSNRERNRS